MTEAERTKRVKKAFDNENYEEALKVYVEYFDDIGKNFAKSELPFLYYFTNHIATDLLNCAKDLLTEKEYNDFLGVVDTLESMFTDTTVKITEVDIPESQLSKNK